MEHIWGEIGTSTTILRFACRNGVKLLSVITRLIIIINSSSKMQIDVILTI